MDKKIYVCLGSDHAVITQEQYDNGLRVCGGKGCIMKGQPFIEGYKCKECGGTFAKGTSHSCLE